MIFARFCYVFATLVLVIASMATAQKSPTTHHCARGPADSKTIQMSATFHQSYPAVAHAIDSILPALGYAIDSTASASGHWVSRVRTTWPEGTEDEKWHGSKSPGVRVYVRATPRGDSTAFVVDAQAACILESANADSSSESISSMLEMIAAMQVASSLSNALKAQQVIPPTRPHDDRAPPPGIRAGAWKYSAHVELRDQRQDLGVRTITIAPRNSEQGPAWLVVMAMQAEGQTLTDSVIMRRSELKPVSRHAVAPEMDLLLVTDDSMAHGLLTAGSSLTPLNVRLRARSFLNYYALRAAFAELPLARGWTGTASVLELGEEPIFASLTLSVVDTERITVPAGAVDCWHVTVKGPGIDEHYWIGREPQDVVRTREPRGGQGAVLQLDLVSFTPH